MFNFIMSPSGTITTIINSAPFSAGPTHPNYDAIKEALKDPNTDAANLMGLFDVAIGLQQHLGQASSGKIEIRDGAVFRDGEQVHGAIADRIMHFLDEGFMAQVDSLVKFLERIDENPDYTSVRELYDFLSHTGLPVTEDGYFLAYKGVRPDFKDIHSGTFDNSPGQRPQMKRNNVDNCREHACSKGLHVGTFEYARSFAGGGPVVLVKVNPRDVVSVPTDCSAQKCRTCEYEVLSVYQNCGSLQNPVYTKDGQAIRSACSTAKGEAPVASDEDILSEQMDWFYDQFSDDEIRDFAYNQSNVPFGLAGCAYIEDLVQYLASNMVFRGTEKAMTLDTLQDSTRQYLRAPYEDYQDVDLQEACTTRGIPEFLVDRWNREERINFLIDADIEGKA